MERSKGRVRILLKFLIGAGLLAVLVRTGVLEPALLARAIRRHPGLLALSLTLYAGIVLAGALRWYLLLRAAGLIAALPRVFSLHMVGLFFNSLLPGGTGGDLVKGYYLFRENAPGRRGLAVTTIVVDRLVGLYGLLAVGMLMACVNVRLALSPRLFPNTVLYAALFGAFTLGIAAYFSRLSGGRLRPVLERLPGRRLRRILYEGLRVYRKAPGTLLATFALTVLVHFILITVYWAMATALGMELPLRVHGFVAPILTLVNGIPLSPGGLGVGEAAGEVMYRLLGVREGGSEVLALVHLCVIVYALLAAPFYVFYGRRGLGRAGAHASPDAGEA